jgi:ribosomal protein S24E
VKIDFISEKNNPLLNRIEVKFKIIESSTPSRADVRQEIASIKEINIENVFIKRIENKTGTRLTFGVAHIYNDRQDAIEIEPDYIKKRNYIEIKEG